jgi:K(+)-stimulated pyrophosphate-energized sodium pump
MNAICLLFAAVCGLLPLLLSESRALASEASLVLPDLSSATFLGGVAGNKLLMGGLLICVLGMVFGLVIYKQLKGLAVHKSMRDISELIYETCKTYLVTQGKFIMLLWAFIGTIMVVYFGVLQHYPVPRVVVIMLFSLVGIAGSYGVAWFGIREYVRQLAHGVCGPQRRPLSHLCHSATRGYEHRHAPHQRRAGDHAGNPAFRAG